MQFKQAESSLDFFFHFFSREDPFQLVKLKKKLSWSNNSFRRGCDFCIHLAKLGWTFCLFNKPKNLQKLQASFYGNVKVRNIFPHKGGSTVHIHSKIETTHLSQKKLRVDWEKVTVTFLLDTMCNKHSKVCHISLLKVPQSNEWMEYWELEWVMLLLESKTISHIFPPPPTHIMAGKRVWVPKMWPI